MYRLDEEQTARIEDLRRIADEQISPYAADVDEQARFPREALDALAQAGWLGLTVPTDYGGQGQGMRVACTTLDEIAQRCASTAMIYLMHLCGCACYTAHANGHADTLREVAGGTHLSTLAWSERGSRSHFWAPVSQAEQSNGQVVLRAQKSFVTSAGIADGYVVSTRTPNVTGTTDTMDTTLYLVRNEDEGLRVNGTWNSMGMRGNASAPMVLENCRVPPERALSDPSQGFPRMLEILPWFNLGNAAVSIGIAEAATRATTTHLTAARLEHMNSRLADLPNLRARLAQMRIETDSARAHLVSALDAVESAAPNAMLLVLASKAAAAEAAKRVTDLGMQTCGGAAFSKHLTLERNFRDSRAMSVMAPTSDVLYDFIGRALCGMDLF